MGTGFALETIVLGRDNGTPLHTQIYAHVRSMVERRVLAPGMAMPSTRQLAHDLGVGRNTVIAAYDQLCLEGFLQPGRGVPPVVKDLPERPDPDGEGGRDDRVMLSERGRRIAEQPYHHGRPGVTAFHPGLPDGDNFPFNTWSKLIARRTKLARGDLFGSYHIAGYPDLRAAIARYLTASRGVLCEPDQIIITNGAQSAFDILARLLLDPGDTVWMEEPGYYGASAAFLSAGARLEPLRVHDDGWRLDPPASAPRAIFVTPSCHQPLGVTMPMKQRLELVRIAYDCDAWIIEDDYDSEYRFQGQPIPALQGVAANARTIFVGTFAKILFPAMRLGYMVVPRGLREAAAVALGATGQFAPLITQAALADFINAGHLTRHLRRMRRLYAQRRTFFMDAFDAHLGAWMDLRRTDSGIQLVGLFRGEADDRAIAAAAARERVNVSPLSLQHRHQPTRSGLVMGFAAADEKATLRGFRALAEVLANGFPAAAHG